MLSCWEPDKEPWRQQEDLASGVFTVMSTTLFTVMQGVHTIVCLCVCVQCDVAGDLLAE